MTRLLLGAGALAGPLWSAVSLAQAFTRDGYDITRHPLSILSNGSLGWVQIMNFVVGGVLLIAGAAGFRRALPGVWVSRLVAVAGVGMIAAGILVMDPGNGFPVGTPSPDTLSWHFYGHMLAGTTTFVALIAACWVLAWHDRSVLAWVAGAALFVGNAWAMSGTPGGSLALAIGAIAAMLWVSRVALGARATMEA